MADLGLFLVFIGFILGIVSGDRNNSLLGALGWFIVLGGVCFIVEGVHQDTLESEREKIKTEINK